MKNTVLWYLEVVGTHFCKKDSPDLNECRKFKLTSKHKAVGCCQHKDYASYCTAHLERSTASHWSICCAVYKLFHWLFRTMSCSFLFSITFTHHSPIYSIEHRSIGDLSFCVSQQSSSTTHREDLFPVAISDSYCSYFIYFDIRSESIYSSITYRFKPT